MAVDWDVADLIYDQELGLAAELQPLLDPVLGVGFRYRGDERHGLGWSKSGSLRSLP